MRGAKEKILAALFASCVLMLSASWPAGAGESDAQRLLTAVDDNLWSNTKTITGRLIIDNGRRERVLTWEVWMEGVERSFSHYLSPPREKGTKMLKIEDKLWLYTPRTDRKILIAGHLMRQSMFGSDLSYEDMMEDKKLSRAYRASLEPCAASEETPCAVLYLLGRVLGLHGFTIDEALDPSRIKAQPVADGLEGRQGCWIAPGHGLGRVGGHSPVAGLAFPLADAAPRCGSEVRHHDVARGEVVDRRV